MIDLLWLAEAILLGVLLAYRWAGLAAVGPVSTRLLILFGTGAAGGIGITAAIYFLAGALPGQPFLAMGLELALLAWSAWEAWRFRTSTSPAATEARTGLSLAMWGCLVLALAIATAAISAGWDAVPHGNWDAWSIWNLRARFLASGHFASGAWSPVLGAYTHAEYPLLLSSFVGRCWAFGRAFSPAVPAAAAYVFFLALLSMVSGGIMAVRGTVVGILAALVLASTPTLLREIPAQYADVPLACYMAGAMVFILLDRPWLAGIFASFAAWTKDEGLLFLAILLVLLALVKRRSVLAALAGAAPIAALDLIFRASIPKGNASQLGGSVGGALHHAADPNRYATVFAAFGHGIADMGLAWYHPLVPLVILAIALGFDRQRRMNVVLCGAATATLLMGYGAAYIVTNYDLQWQLQSSLNRLLVQAWPLVVITAFSGLNVWQATPATSPPPPRKVQRKAARKKGAS